MKFLVFVAVLVAYVSARPPASENKVELVEPERLQPFDCEPCTKICPTKLDCAFGKVKDRCGCCDVCGVGLDAQCDLPGKEYKFGSCGEDMVCRMRKDPEERVTEQPLCECAVKKPVCGNNNETYENICHLKNAASFKENKGLEPLHRNGPCRTAPKIKTAPQNTKRPVGNNVFLSCEAKGYPIPTIEWIWKDSENQTRYLPTDDAHISVNNRGGPERYMITGWVQIMNLKAHHEGDFICVAQNEVGMDSKVARVNLDIRDNADL